MPSVASGTTSDHSHPRSVPLNFAFRSRWPKALMRAHCCMSGRGVRMSVFWVMPSLASG